jgi:hypothetical protein
LLTVVPCLPIQLQNLNIQCIQKIV